MVIRFYKIYLLAVILLLLPISVVTAKSFLSSKITDENGDFGIDDVPKLKIFNLDYKKYNNSNFLAKNYNSNVIFDSLKLLADDDYERAFELLKNLTVPKDTPKDSIYEVYLYLLTYLYLSNNDYDNTYRLSSEYLNYFPDYKDYYIMLYYNLYAALQANQKFYYEESLKQNILIKINEKLAIHFKKLINYYTQFKGKYILNVSYLYEEQDEELIIENIQNTYDLDLLAVYQKFYKSDEILEQVFLRQTKLSFFRGDLSQVTKNIEEIKINSEKYSGDLLDEIEDLEEELADNTTTNIIKIGFLLPFSIDVYQIKKIISDIQTSINIFFKNNNQKYEFVFEDSALQPKIAKAAYSRLVNQGVIAVIGPISRLNSKSLLQSSSNYRVPVFSLTSKEYIGSGYPYFYRYQRNIFKENEILAAYAVDYLNSSSFIAFYDSEESYQYVIKFNEEVIKRNGKLVGVEKIDPQQNDLRSGFRNVTGVFRYLNRSEKDLFESLEGDKTVQESRIDSFYLPFSPERIHFISSFLSSYNLENINIITNGAANLPELELLSVKNLYFTDNFSLYEKDYLGDQFVNYHRFTDTNKKPSFYSIAVYDLLELIDELVINFNLKDPQSLKLKLDQINNTPFLKTKLNIDRNREFNRDYKVYRLSKNRIKTVF